MSKSKSKLKTSKRAERLIESPIRKFLPLVRGAEAGGVEVIKLNVGDPDIQVPEEILRSIRIFRDKNIRYAPSPGISEHVEAWLVYYKNVGVRLRAENIIPSVGAGEAILLSFMAVADAGDEVIVFEPLFSSYKGLATICDVKLVPIRLKLENNFQLPSEKEIVKKISKKTRAIVVINPDNPTGKVWRQEELKLVVKIAKKYNLFILSDETYREIRFKGKPMSLLNYTQVRQNVIVIDSVSKRFSVPGIRIGVMASYNRQIMQVLLKMAMARLSAPTLGQLSLISVLKNSKSYTQKITKEYEKRHRVVNDALKRIPGLIKSEPEGAFYQVVRLPVRDAEQFIKFLITRFRYKNRTILLAPMQDFYITPGLGKNEVRIAYVVGANKLKQGMEIFKRGLEEYIKK
jgi:aspartate aminotransferase